MIARITNYGKTRALPTCIGNVYMVGRSSVEVNNRKAIEELAAFPFVGIEILVDDQEAAEAEGAPRIDYSKYPINELRSIAAAVGIAGFFTMTKPVLIKSLEDQNG